MVDARTTSRWYFVIAMGRKAGHLALGMGKAAGATLTLIPEEFGEKIGVHEIVDTLVGAIIKRLSDGRRDGVAVIAEGVVLNIDPEDLAQLEDVEHDAHGHVRIAEVNIGEILKAEVQKRLGEFGIKTTIVAKNIGYELRCADPIPMDMEYTRDLGYCAAKYLISGGTGVMVTMQAGQFVPVPFSEMLDPRHGSHEGAPRRHPLGTLRDRPPVHAAAATRRLRRPARAGEVRRRCGDEPGAVPCRVREPGERGAAGPDPRHDRPHRLDARRAVPRATTDAGGGVPGRRPPCGRPVRRRSAVVPDTRATRAARPRHGHGLIALGADAVAAICFRPVHSAETMRTTPNTVNSAAAPMRIARSGSR